MAITAQDVNRLRQETGAGMMDCKKALTEANGDFEAAKDILRKAGQKIASKRADNVTSEGIVLTQVNTDGKLYYYKLIDESSYHIRSYGRDGLINTADDILPSPIKNVGLVADYQVSSGL